MVSAVALLLWLMVLAPTTHTQSCENADAEVLILGAGIAGISAAKTLHDNGITNFIILEQRDRIGGRINSSQFAGATIELGPQWIVGSDPSAPLSIRNPIIRLAQQCGLQYRQFPLQGTFKVYNREGGDITNDALATFGSQFFPASAGALQQLAQLQEEDPLGDQDLSLDAAYRLSGWNARNPVQQWIEYFAVDFPFAVPADALSFRRSLVLGLANAEFGNNTGNYLVTDPRGYMHIVDCLAEDFLATDDPRLHLNTIVTSIQWSDDCVCASVMENGENGRYCAPYSMFTFSVGVIENNVVQFIPPLPYSRSFAINHHSMANFLKIWIAFNETFWDEDVEWIGYVDEVNGREYYPFFTPLGTHLPGRPNIIEAFVTGETALRVAQQDIELTRLQIAEVLRRMYGQHASDPTDIIMHNFITNRYFYGDFSTPIPGVGLRNYQTLNSPLGRMYFAGEVTSARYRSSVHGAYLSGADQANTVFREIVASRQVNFQFINDSPRVVGNSISAEFVTSEPVASLICGLTGQPTQDCSSGRVNYTSLRPGDYILRVAASNGRDDRRVQRRALYIASDPSECSVHLINGGVVVTGNNATVEFAGSGSFSSFSCRLDREDFLPCSTPHELSNLGAGTHRIRIRPRDCGGSINQISVNFSV